MFGRSDPDPDFASSQESVPDLFDIMADLQQEVFFFFANKYIFLSLAVTHKMFFFLLLNLVVNVESDIPSRQDIMDRFLSVFDGDYPKDNMRYSINKLRGVSIGKY